MLNDVRALVYDGWQVILPASIRRCRSTGEAPVVPCGSGALGPAGGIGEVVAAALPGDRWTCSSRGCTTLPESVSKAVGCCAPPRRGGVVGDRTHSGSQETGARRGGRGGGAFRAADPPRRGVRIRRHPGAQPGRDHGQRARSGGPGVGGRSLGATRGRAPEAAAADPASASARHRRGITARASPAGR